MPDYTYAIDVSNYQGFNITDLILEHKPAHIVVRLSTESDQHREIARQQLSTARLMGCTVAGYIWAYWDLDAALHVADALSVAGDAPLTHVWLDCEDEADAAKFTTIPWIRQAVAEIEGRGLRAGIYTGRYFWRDRVGDATEFNTLPLWLASYDGRPQLASNLLPFGGWTRVAGHQWSGDPDRSVFDPAIFAQPAPAVPAPADEVATLRLALADVCDRIGDALAVPVLAKKKRLALVGQMRREREQFIGARP